MVKGWIVTNLVVIVAALCSARADDVSPLLPHPAERLKRPVYSQDKYKRDPTPEEAPIEPEPPVYTQDKYRPNEPVPDYSGQLRRVPEKGREWSEIEIAKGIVQLNAGKLDEAATNFHRAFKQDPRNFVALEYLGVVYENKGDLPTAISYLAKSKHIAPKGRWGQTNFQIGRIYLLLKNYERSEIYLRLALDEGGQSAAVNYTLGYLLYLEERFFEAEHFLHTARMRVTRRTALPAERQMLQAINYYLGEIYARLGFIPYAVTMLRGTEIGDSWEVRQGAWRVHSELNHWSWYATVGAFGQFDSNVPLVPVDGELPSNFSNQESLSTVLSTNFGVQTSPAKRWVAGADGLFYLNYHFNSTLAPFDVFDWGLGGWVNYWNQNDWSWLAKLDHNSAQTDRNNFTLFQNATTLSAAITYTPFQRWAWEGGFQYRINHFETDIADSPDQRSGHTYVGYLRASLKAPNPRLRPTFGYTFEADATEGVNFQARNHTLLLEADYRLFARTHIVAGFTITRIFYPNHLQGRRDDILQARATLNHSFSEHWAGIVDVTQYENTSTLAGFSYKRLIFTSGLTYTF